MALTAVALEGNHRLARDIHPLPGGVERDTEADGSLSGTPGGAVGNTAVDVSAFAKHLLSSWLLFLSLFPKPHFITCCQCSVPWVSKPACMSSRHVLRVSL